jgi:hypothetical protein
MKKTSKAFIIFILRDEKSRLQIIIRRITSAAAAARTSARRTRARIGTAYTLLSAFLCLENIEPSKTHNY